MVVEYYLYCKHCDRITIWKNKEVNGAIVPYCTECGKHD